MPNHWHLILWPKGDHDLSEYMRWLTVTHTQRWHSFHGTSGSGPIYQGRYKSFPIQADEHFYTVCRYVERNALKANLVGHAENWRWSSLWQNLNAPADVVLDRWPIRKPDDWVRWVNQPQSESEVAAVQRAIQRGSPFGKRSGQPYRYATAAEVVKKGSGVCPGSGGFLDKPLVAACHY